MQGRFLMRFAHCREPAMQGTDAWKGHPQSCREAQGGPGCAEDPSLLLRRRLSASDEGQIARIPELNVLLASPCGV